MKNPAGTGKTRVMIGLQGCRFRSQSLLIASRVIIGAAGCGALTLTRSWQSRKQERTTGKNVLQSTWRKQGR